MRSGVIVLCLVQFVDVLGVTSVVTAIPAILTGIGAPSGAAGPVSTTYAMFFGAMLILGARLGDRFGHRRILLTGIAVFGAVSIIGGTAADLPQVLIARGVQGAAAAISAPSALRLILHATPSGGERSRALAAWSAVGAMAGATGFLVGGLLTTTLGWRAVFWVNAPVSVVLFIAVLLAIREQPTDRDPSRLDVLGALLLVTAVMPVVAGAALLERAESRVLGVALLVVGAAVGGLLVWRFRVAASPLVPRAAFKAISLRRGTIQSFVNTGTTSSASVLATLVLQDRLGVSPLLSGVTLMSFSVAVIAGSAVAGRVASKVGPDDLAAAGLATISCGNIVLALTFGSWFGVGAGAATLGFGLAAASVAATGLGTTVPGALEGSAAGIVNTGAQIGTAIGTAVVVLVATSFSPPIGWLVAAIAAAACAFWCATRSRLHGPASSSAS
ncbi:MFS transporter [Curtobacterium flaccumfaciens]|uniref:MFS transporter n=1 Tax=Curtobacterium flaccumfaciens TaxID=2035 RepID=UPI0015FFCF44|nr:MFS transporter [Curtobacterium flaccumfaciens]MBB1195628.1 MFS transporter [Curtobacterium flaccumfaciens]